MLTAGSYSIPPNPPAAKFVSQGDAHITTDDQIKFLHYWPVLGYLRYYNNLVKLPPSVLIFVDLPILILSTFRAFNYYSIMGFNELFWSSASWDIGNNKVKSYFGNSEIEILYPFLEISEHRKLTLQIFFFLKKTLKYTYQQRDATNGYCKF